MQQQSQHLSIISLAKCDNIKIEDTFQECQSLDSGLSSPKVELQNQKDGQSQIANVPPQQLRSLLLEMSSLKSQFDAKWSVLLTYIDQTELFSFPHQKINQAKSVEEKNQTQDFNGLTMAHQNFNIAKSVDDENSKEMEGALLQQPNQPKSNVSQSTNMLIRDQLNAQLMQAREIILRDERAKVQLIERMRFMHQEINELQEQLKQQNEQQNTIIEENQQIQNQVAENSIVVEEYNLSQRTLSKSDGLRKNSLDESELVHFSVLPENYENGDIILLENINGSSSREYQLTLNRPSSVTNKTRTTISGQENVVDTNQGSYQIQNRIESLQSEEDLTNEEDLSLREDLQMEYSSQNHHQRQSTYQSITTESGQFNSQSLGKSIPSHNQQLQPLSLILKNGINQQDNPDFFQQILINKYSEAKPLKPRHSPQNHPLTKVSPLSINNSTGGYKSSLNFLHATPLHQRPQTSGYPAYRPLTERHSRNNTSGIGVFNQAIPTSNLLSITQLKQKITQQQITTSIKPFAQGMEELQEDSTEMFEYGKMMRQAAATKCGETLGKKYMTNNQRVISEESLNGCLSPRLSQSNQILSKKSPQKQMKSPSTKKKREKENLLLDSKPSSSSIIGNLKSPKQMNIYHQNRRPLKQSNKKNKLQLAIAGGIIKPGLAMKDSSKIRDPQKTIQILSATGMYTQRSVKSTLQQSVSEANFSPKRFAPPQAFANTLRPTFSSHYLASPRTFGLNNL